MVQDKALTSASKDDLACEASVFPGRARDHHHEGGTVRRWGAPELHRLDRRLVGGHNDRANAAAALAHLRVRPRRRKQRVQLRSLVENE